MQRRAYATKDVFLFSKSVDTKGDLTKGRDKGDNVRHHVKSQEWCCVLALCKMWHQVYDERFGILCKNVSRKKKKNFEMQTSQKVWNMEQVRVWMKSTDKVNSVQSERGKFTQSYEEANDMHECFLNLNLPED